MSEKRRVAICGTAPASLKEAPFHDETWEIWGTSRLWKEIPRADVWFELHPLDEIGRGWNVNLEQREAAREEHVEWMAQAGLPVYLQEEDERVPTGVPYPLEEVEAFLESEFGDVEAYFTNTIAYMIALAIYQGVDEIGVWGVDMALACLAPDERVLTADLEWVPAKDVHEGDRVMAFDEKPGSQMDGDHHTRRWRVAEVEGKSKADRPSYRIHLEDGRTIVASKDHRWLTYGEHQMKWKRTEELVTNMHRDGRPTRIHSPIDTWQEDRSWQAGYLAAAFDGEGSISQRPVYEGSSHSLCMTFAQRDNGMADKVRASLAAKGFRWSENSKSGSGGGVAAPPTVQYNLLGGRPEVMRFLGQIRPRRLLENFDPTVLGQFTKKDAVAVEKIEPVGEIETIGFTTTTGTMVVEGLASHNSEYEDQRPSCEYFIGLARGYGIPVHVPKTADLLKTAVKYGYDWEKEEAFRAKMDARNRELAERKQNTENKKHKLFGEAKRLEGAVQSIAAILENGSALPEDDQKALKQHAEEMNQQRQQIASKMEELNRAEAGFSYALDNLEWVERTWIGCRPGNGEEPATEGPELEVVGGA